MAQYGHRTMCRKLTPPWDNSPAAQPIGPVTPKSGDLGMQESCTPPVEEQPEQAPSGGHGEKKDRMKEQAIAALLDQPSIARAARALGISEYTLNCWLKDPAFPRDG